jgi:ceramide glucosyltransferase
MTLYTYIIITIESRMLYYILLFLGSLALIGEITLIILWLYPRIQNKKEKKQSYFPKTAVIVPCKGINNHFQENIDAICNQEYPDFKIIFIIDATDDPAYPFLKGLQSRYQNVTIELSDHHEDCSGKIAAQLKGVSVAGSVDVFVFADSDIRPHPKWLQYLVQPLENEKIGAATGYRWYFPENKTSTLISTWNMAIMVGLFYQITNYTWGGSTAIRKTVFEQLDVASRWRKGLSDDLILTEILKKKKYKIKFVPQSTVESHADETLSSFMRWGSRQMTWMRWYYPSLWFFSFCMFLGLEILSFLGIIFLLVGCTTLGLILVSSIFFQMIYGYTGFTTLRKLMCYPKERFRSAFLPSLLLPFVFFLLTYNMASSGLKRDITWCGRIYKKSDFLKKQ